MRDVTVEVSENGVSYRGFLVETGNGILVPISHWELDTLVGRLMQMCDLIGDVEQRSALKSTIKQITREWLDNEYDNRGYDKWTGQRKGSHYIDATESGDAVIHTIEK
jgi:hypothetical protein